MEYRKCFDDSILLVEEAVNCLNEIKSLYDKSVERQEIDKRLPIVIKSTLEHLRSSLDFIAQGLVIKYSPKKGVKAYFPYAKTETGKKEFIKANRVEKAIPGITSRRPDLVEIIIAMQHFSSPGARWFPEFMELNNTNKHIHLVPQGYSKGVCLDMGGSKLMAKSITLEEGSKIVTSEGELVGPLSITPENIDEFNSLGVFGADMWEGIYIDGYGFPSNSCEYVSHCVKAISSVVELFNEKVA